MHTYLGRHLTLNHCPWVAVKAKILHADSEDVHPQMVRWLADFVAEPLSKLFAVVPTDWRLAIICLLHRNVTHRSHRESHFYNIIYNISMYLGQWDVSLDPI